VKPFVCGFERCGRAFGFKKVMERHELTHTMPVVRTRKRVTKDVGVIDEIAGTGYQDTGRDIPCTVDGCEWRFTRDYDLKRHIRSMHKETNGDTNMDTDDGMDEDMSLDEDE
jgi:general transcription factor IIIA